MGTTVAADSAVGWRGTTLAVIKLVSATAELCGTEIS